jgi:iron complex outermembrane receptor protein
MQMEVLMYDGSTSDSNTFLNPAKLSKTYTDYTNTNKLLVKSTLKITNDLNYQFLFGVETSNSANFNWILPWYPKFAQATQQGTGELKFGQAGINQIEKFNKTFEHTLNYINHLIFQFDALAGYSYYDYAGSRSNCKGI